MKPWMWSAQPMPAYGKYLTDTFSEAITRIVSIVAPNKLQS